MGLKKENNKDLSKYLQKSYLRLLSKIMPISWLRYIFIFLGEIYYKEAKAERKKTIKEIIKTDLNPNKKSDIRKLTKQIYLGIYTHYYEKYVTGYYSFTQYKKYVKKNIDIQNRNLLDQALDKDGNIILITAHFGAVEFLPLYLSLTGYKVRMVAKGKTQTIMKAYKSRARKGNLSIIDGSKSNVFNKAVNWLTHGKKRILIVMGDEFKDWKLSRNGKLNFLGHQVRPDKFIKLLYTKSRACILEGFLLRTNINKYNLIIEKPHNGNANILLGNVLSCMEKYIKEYPEQWYQWTEWAAIKDRLK